MMLCLCLLALSVAPAASSVPRFDIDLDLPPQERFKAVHEHFREEGQAMVRSTKKNLAAHFTPDELEAWTKVARSAAGDEILEEIEGIAEVLNVTQDMDTLILSNILYELESPTLCSGFVAADEQGKVIHGRNMDYRLQFVMPDGTMEDWPNVTYEAHFHKGGKDIFMTIAWVLYTGAHTGFRFDGWTFEQNTRPSNDAALNLAAGQEGGVPFGWKVRKYLETIPDFQTALSTINATKFMAPQYFIMSGSQPFEGAVISMDRLAAESLPDTPPVRQLGEGHWYLLQTNDDVNKLPHDPRRPLTHLLLLWYGPKDVTVDNVWNLMLGPTLHDFLTVFTWVAVPSTNYFAVALPGQSKPTVLQEPLATTQIDTEEVVLAQKFLARSLKKSPSILGGSRKRWRHVVSDDGIRLVPVHVTQS